jgi:hypothetical protein
MLIFLNSFYQLLIRLVLRRWDSTYSITASKLITQKRRRPIFLLISLHLFLIHHSFDFTFFALNDNSLFILYLNQCGRLWNIFGLTLISYL